jgi:organic hydroperoxide reductase OsmC/OhrA
MAHDYRATIVWKYQGGDFAKGRYSRAHEWRFDGGVTVPASPSPGIVPAQFLNAQSVDPEEALVAALSACHMLTFLDLARRAGAVIESYEDEAIGVMEEIAAGRRAITKVTLRPRIAFTGTPPDAEKLEALHHQAHDYCIIANSVKTEVVVEARS